MNSTENQEKLFQNFTQLKKHLKSIVETIEVYKVQQNGFTRLREDLSSHKEFIALHAKYEKFFDEKIGTDMIISMESKWNCLKKS